MIVYDDRADMILSVRRQHRNKSVHVHEKNSFPKDFVDYTTKPLFSQDRLSVSVHREAYMEAISRGMKR